MTLRESNYEEKKSQLVSISSLPNAHRLGAFIKFPIWKMGKTYAQALEEVLGVGVDIQLAGLGLANIQSRDLRDVLVLALTLLFLELEGDTADGTTLDTLHQVRSVTGNLVAETLGGNDGDLIAKALVGLEVESQLGVVTLDDDLGRLLDGLLCKMRR